jgi:hypothetical protein
VSRIDEEDHARGARVEIAIRAAQSGDLATAAGILAGMSGEERDAIAPLIAAAAGSPTPTGPLSDLFGTQTLARADRSTRHLGPEAARHLAALLPQTPPEAT